LVRGDEFTAGPGERERVATGGGLAPARTRYRL